MSMKNDPMSVISKKRKHKEASNKSDASTDSGKMKFKRKHKKHKKSASSESDSSINRKQKKKHSKHKKNKEKTKKKLKEKVTGKEDDCFDVPISLMNPNTSRTPMTKEEWEKKQNVVKRVFDETSGRYRLIKGDGEVVEEIVSKDRHKEINQKATSGDGLYFQTQLSISQKK